LEGTHARIVDTRKTTPGLRELEKYAVRMGGGYNHRFNLSDGVMLKDNHIEAAGGITNAVSKVRATLSHMTKIEVEVENLFQFEEAMAAGAEVILLDNMDTETMAKAVAMKRGNVILEASGNITLERLSEIAATGVDIISSGALTHSVKSLDISLDLHQA
jgi:nicotinate-nucleotide pyrophosphorylase (carboxylating)